MITFFQGTHTWKSLFSSQCIEKIIYLKIERETFWVNMPFGNRSKCAHLSGAAAATHDGSAAGPHCARFPNGYLPKLPPFGDFKRIPPFCGPLVEVKEAVIMIDCETATWLVEWARVHSRCLLLTSRLFRHSVWLQSCFSVVKPLYNCLECVRSNYVNETLNLFNFVLSFIKKIIHT